MDLLPPDAGVPDFVLVATMLRGGLGAFQVLFARYYAPLLRYLGAQTRDPDVASELAQETFLAAFLHREDLASGRPFQPWLYRIGRNNVLMWARRPYRTAVSLDLMRERGQEAVIASLADDLSTLLAERETVRRVIAELTPALRQVLLLNVVYGLPARQVAEHLGLTLVATERRLSRAKARFRTLYDELATEE